MRFAVSGARPLSAAAVIALITGCAENHGISPFDSLTNGSSESNPRPSVSRLVAGCSPQVTLRKRSAIARGADVVPDAAASDFFISDFDANLVAIYSQKGKKHNPIGEITNGISAPLGVYVSDKTRDLYVANYGTDDVVVYKPGGTSPIETLTGLNGPAADVTVDLSGNVYVTTFASNTIFVFAKGSTKPTSTLTDNNQPLYWITSDPKRDIFVNGFGGFVDEFRAGSSSPETLPITFQYPGGLSVDQKNDLVVADQGGSSGGGNITSYAIPGYSAIYSISYNGDIAGITGTRNSKDIWGANVGNVRGEEYSIASSRLVGTTGPGVLECPIGTASLCW